MAFTTIVTGTTITSSWANIDVRNQVVTPFPSTAARSAAITSPVTGMVSALTTNDATEGLYVYNSAGVWEKDWSTAWGEAATRVVLSASFTQSSSADYDITGLAITWTAIANRKYMVEMFVPVVLAAAGVAAAVGLAEGITTVQACTVDGVAGGVAAPVLIRTLPVTYSAGAHTLKGFVHVNGGSGAMTASARGGYPYIAVFDVGPGGAPS